VFFRPGDAQVYLGWLQEAAARHRVAIHAYVLMTNHNHLLVSPETAFSLPRAMRHVNWRYSRYANDSQARTGSIWEGRYRAHLVEADRYFFACMRYIEMNPVRAGMAKTPRDYRWSSYKANAEAKADPIITPHPLYADLGATAEGRAENYRSLFDDVTAESELNAIRDAISGGWPLGAEGFTSLVSRHAGQSMQRGQRGRRKFVPGTN
jgi:putative transposase